MRKFFDFILRVLGIRKPTPTQPKVVPSPAKVEEHKHEEPKVEEVRVEQTWVNPEPYKETVNILDEVVTDLAEAKEEKKEE
jgi:hypothetical protein